MLDFVCGDKDRFVMRLQSQSMDAAAVKLAYRRWAPVYDYTFGLVARAGRKHVAGIINNRRGSVLEVGVGTGLSLSRYGRHLTITGIDLSQDMLEKARERVKRAGFDHVEGLHEMDAGALTFPSESFDTVVAMYVMTVVPEPEKVMAELERVCKPGGEVILVNHFSQSHGLRGWIERKMVPFAATIGWRPVFPLERVLGQKGLRLKDKMPLSPFGLFTMARFVREERPPGHSKAHPVQNHAMA